MHIYEKFMNELLKNVVRTSVRYNKRKKKENQTISKHLRFLFLTLMLMTDAFRVDFECRWHLNEIFPMIYRDKCVFLSCRIREEVRMSLAYLALFRFLCQNVLDHLYEYKLCCYLG